MLKSSRAASATGTRSIENEDIKTPKHLWAAQDCLQKNTVVQELCVLDVPRFKRQLTVALKSFSAPSRSAM